MFAGSRFMFAGSRFIFAARLLFPVRHNAHLQLNQRSSYTDFNGFDLWSYFTLGGCTDATRVRKNSMSLKRRMTRGACASRIRAQASFRES
jgi:hypothetical protein